MQTAKKIDTIDINLSGVEPKYVQLEPTFHRGNNIYCRRICLVTSIGVCLFVFCMLTVTTLWYHQIQQNNESLRNETYPFQMFPFNLRKRDTSGVITSETIHTESGGNEKDISSRTKRAIVPSAKLQEYYDCLERVKKEHDENVAKPKFKWINAGKPVQILNCNICIRPDQDQSKYNVKWTRSLLIKPGEVTIESDKEGHIQITDTWNLVIERPQVEDSGRYTCYRNDQYQAMYQLDVLEAEKTVMVVDGAIPGRKPKDPEDISGRNLILFTGWSNWTDCTACNKRGERRKTGMCMVKRKYTEMENLEHLKILERYPEGLPCRSSLLPIQVSSLEQVKLRPSEVMTGYCFVNCVTEPPIREIYDEDGNVIDMVEPGQGLYSVHETPPKIAPLVKRNAHYRDVGTMYIIDCPIDNAASQAIRWQNDTQVINPITIRRSTKGRVFIDIKNRLTIMKLEPWDTAYYNCFVNSKQVASIKIITTTPTDRNIRDYITLLGVGMFAILCFMMGCQMVKTSFSHKYRKSFW